MDDTTDTVESLRFRPVESPYPTTLMGDFWATYRHLLKRPVGTELTTLIEERDLPESTIREHVERLCAIGVAQCVPHKTDAWVPVSPEHTLRNHLEAERRKVHLLQAELDDLHALTYSLISDYHDSRIAPNNDYITHVVHPADIRRLQGHVAGRLSRRAKYTCPWRPSKEVLQEAKAADQVMLDTGAQLYGLYLTSAASDPHMTSYLNWMVEEGAEIRLAPSVPFYCHIVDDSFLFANYDNDDDDAGVISTKVPEIVRAFDFVFDALWEKAAPYVPTSRRGLTAISSTQGGSGNDISLVERSLLQSLASGKKDESVARSLNVSVRTVRRIVAELCDKCNVASRFELAVVAERQGWLKQTE